MKNGSPSLRKANPNPGSQLPSAKDATLTGEKTPLTASKNNTKGTPIKRMATKRGSVRTKAVPINPVAITVTSNGANPKNKNPNPPQQ